MSGRQIRWSRLVTGAGLASRWDAGSADPLITSVVEDSREAVAGSCFVAARGLRADGHAFVGSALQSGACAVVSERPVELPAGVPGVQVASARGVAGRLAAVLYGLDALQRAGRLRLVGITGTNGKSTFCYLLRAILEAARCPTAMLGTIQYDLGCRTVQAPMTTPPAATLMRYLAEAVDGGATHAVLEVSSHALDQGRCDGLQFGVGVFSNLSGDHLDYHRDMPSYLRAKKKLFDGLAPDAVAVVNRDDEACEAMIADCRARVIRYGLEGSGARGPGFGTRAGEGARGRGGEGGVERWRDGETEGWRDGEMEGGRNEEMEGGRNKGTGDREPGRPRPGCVHDRASTDAPGAQAGSHEPDVWARVLRTTSTGTRFELLDRHADQGLSQREVDSCVVDSALIGEHNVLNCLAAAGAALALGVPLGTVAAGLASVRHVPGRLQRVEIGGGGREDARDPGVTVLVDYAHTDDALENVLSALKPLAKKDGRRLIVLFGCGGDRDRTKRPRMARAAARWSDRIVLTSDNPRTEDPRKIIEDVVAGFSPQQRERVHVEPDRRRAIADAIAMADRGDVVLLAGKGHEDYQEIGRERVPFDDAVVAAEALRGMMTDR